MRRNLSLSSSLGPNIEAASGTAIDFAFFSAKRMMISIDKVLGGTYSVDLGL